MYIWRRLARIGHEYFISIQSTRPEAFACNLVTMVYLTVDNSNLMCTDVI